MKLFGQHLTLTVKALSFFQLKNFSIVSVDEYSDVQQEAPWKTVEMVRCTFKRF